MRKTTIGSQCMCLPDKCYGNDCQYCKDADCVKGNEVIFGVSAEGFVWVLVAGFSPFPIGVIVGVVLTVAGR